MRPGLRICICFSLEAPQGKTSAPQNSPQASAGHTRAQMELPSFTWRDSHSGPSKDQLLF